MMKFEITGDDNQCCSSIAESVPKRPKSLTDKRAREIRQFLSLVIKNPQLYVVAGEGGIDLDHVKTNLKEQMNQTKGRGTLGFISDRDVNCWLRNSRFTRKMNIIKSIHFNPMSIDCKDNASIRNVKNEVSVTKKEIDDDMETCDFDFVATIPPYSNSRPDGDVLMGNRFDRFFGPYPDPFAWATVIDDQTQTTFLPQQTEPLDLSVASKSKAVVDKGVEFPGKLKTRWIGQYKNDLKPADLNQSEHTFHAECQ